MCSATWTAFGASGPALRPPARRVVLSLVPTPQTGRYVDWDRGLGLQCVRVLCVLRHTCLTSTLNPPPPAHCGALLFLLILLCLRLNSVHRLPLVWFGLVWASFLHAPWELCVKLPDLDKCLKRLSDSVPVFIPVSCFETVTDALPR